MGHLVISFRDKKQQRKANWLVKQFARENALLVPQSPESYRDLVRQRGLGRQYRSSDGKVFFPTNTGWDFFTKFVDVLHEAEPFCSKATCNDVYQAYLTALADMISTGVLPESCDDFSDYLPKTFIDDLELRGEARFHKLAGVAIKGDVFLRIGETWIGTFGNLSFEALASNNQARQEQMLDSLNQVFDQDTPVISGARIQATTDRAELENTLKCEMGLGVLDIMLNMTYENAFSRLWTMRRIERPEHGVAKQLSFGFARDSTDTRAHLTLSTRFVGRPFKIDHNLASHWHDSLLLSEFNRICATDSTARTELHRKLLNSIMYFRQASLQSTPEMQMAMLWVCVESILTASSDRVLEANLPSLLAITIWSLNRELWPNRSENVKQLEATFRKYYRSRSKTFHHGAFGHVRAREVQQFSIVVSNLLVGIARLAMTGIGTTASLLEASKRFLAKVNQ